MILCPFFRRKEKRLALVCHIPVSYTHLDVYKRQLDKRRLREKMGSLDEKAMRHVDEALAVSFGLGSVQGLSLIHI